MLEKEQPDLAEWIVFLIPAYFLSQFRDEHTLRPGAFVEMYMGLMKQTETI